MNYQFPLLNLVTRGHLRVKNPIGTQKFIENLDNDSCKAILESLLFVPDSSECVRILENIQESYELKNNIRHNVSERTLNMEKTNILLREIEDISTTMELPNVQDNIDTILKYIKIGVPTAAALYILRIPKAERDAMFQELQLKHTQAFNLLRSSPILRKVMPEEVGFLGRTAKAAWTMSKDPLKDSDKAYLGKIGHLAKTSALIAGGVIGGVIAINILYKQVFSEEARKCKGLFGKNRSICMSKAVIEAAERAMAKSEDSLLKCDAAKDPQDCRFKIKCEIYAWKRKIEEHTKKLARLQAVNNKPFPKKPENTSPVKVSPPYDPFGEQTEPQKKPVSIPVTPSKTHDPFGSVDDLNDTKKINPFG